MPEKSDRLKKFREFFGNLNSSEIVQFKKNDPEGFEQIAAGIMDGSLTY